MSNREKVIKQDEATYQLVFEQSTKNIFGFSLCSECGKAITNRFRDNSGRVVARYQYSHILSKGAFPEYRHNPLNFNILCMDDHQQWETGDRKSMRIYEKNQQIIEQLKNGE
jgi:hypothetical protein